jgi:hypothetical protein
LSLQPGDLAFASRNEFVRGPEMKAFIAALIAGAVLYFVDSQYNDGRYSAVVKQAITSMVAR